ncbi:hypothetical protein C8R45DRAFT_1099729 [Mycena sanguinolenta]|nr:hypothetical protein C8R45DRAFT_1099721 [Mycena sanguinolenta]KAJ6482437.1 hypothetical protein C8R45DRAFT_1099725 [Mycena sanguinolenta]KAJ6482442.1 hypothetical protein C8R45DRAFT_1099729 [Mycena sanguinolenta]
MPSIVSRYSWDGPASNAPPSPSPTMAASRICPDLNRPDALHRLRLLMGRYRLQRGSAAVANDARKPKLSRLTNREMCNYLLFDEPAPLPACSSRLGNSQN